MPDIQNLDLQGIAMMILIGFALYTLVVFTAFSFVKNATVPIFTFEIYRVALKFLFWVSFLVFIILEVYLTLAFLGAKLASIPFRSVMVFLYSLVGVSEDRSGFELWAVYSLILLCIVMTPYMTMFGAITKQFKQTALQLAQKGLPAGQSVRILSFNPGRQLPDVFARQLVQASEEAMTWVTRTFEPDSPYRFTVESWNQDLFTYEQGEQQLKWWESRIQINVEEQKKNSDGKTVWDPVHSEALFNGICVRVPEVFDKGQPTNLTLARHLSIGERGQSVRERRHYNAIARLLDEAWTVRGTNDLILSKKSKLEDFTGALESNPALANEDRHLVFVGTEARDLILFFHTGLSGNLFEFNLGDSARRNVAAFEEDLRLVLERLRATEPLIAHMTTNRALPDLRPSAAA